MIQVNVLHGKYWDALVAFLRAENPDIITMQEVTTGAESFSDNKKTDLFIALRDVLDMEGVYEPSFHLADEPTASFGNAVFVRGNIRSHTVAWLRPHHFLTEQERWDEQYWPLFPRNILDAIVDIGGTTMHVLSVHGAWYRRPVDTPENTRQAEIIAAHIRSLGTMPFCMGGDLNMTPETRVIQTIDAVAKNAIHGSGIMRTLHPIVHKTVKEKPEGFVVDYIYTSSHFTVKTIDSPVVDVSDHLPVRATLVYDNV